MSSIHIFLNDADTNTHTEIYDLWFDVIWLLITNVETMFKRVCPLPTWAFVTLFQIHATNNDLIQAERNSSEYNLKTTVDKSINNKSWNV